MIFCPGVLAQIKNWAVEPILWDDLSPSALKDAVVGTYVQYGK